MSEHSDEEEMQATEKDSEHGEEEMFADDEEPDFTVDWGRDLCSFPLGAVFTGTPGMYLPDDFLATPTPLDFDKLIINDAMVRLFKTETNVCKGYNMNCLKPV